MSTERNSSRGRQQRSNKSAPKRNNNSEGSFDKKPGGFKKRPSKFEKSAPAKVVKNDVGGIRLNKYISNSGVCSRREADVLIAAGSAMVNGKVITEMGYKVQLTDEVRFDGTLINPETKRYVLLNKPKNYITTMDDERGRKTVMELVHMATKERIYPVGRLDRNTTGLLLFTNDGELAKKLTHPKHNVRKLYHASLDRKFAVSDLQKLSTGEFMVEGKKVFIDDVAYVEGQSKSEVGIEIHSGRNRIVRKIFDTLGYKVVKLDRVIFAGMTKKNIQRGHWRHLTEQELNNLKMI
ncbi:pseudouridine synthase [Flavicella sp.]|uniref:pseudouridine synthase n=1 Tax=Flavicella sp. TaxID=2957742 RepID=UPI00260F503E|nr:pseudouridine synthase [Flavicella sp.]MDG1804525.1 pseudouridine synthase [Flavicella sp.]MDG2281331.1 pseudouridine synthase [Flavicella sp.]